MLSASNQPEGGISLKRSEQNNGRIQVENYEKYVDKVRFRLSLSEL